MKLLEHIVHSLEISTLGKWEVKAENNEEKFEYDVKLDIGFLVQDLTGFLMAMRSSRSGYRLQLSKTEIDLPLLF